MKMKKIPVAEAVGSILCHDITQIIPGEFKGRAFKKGHIITEEDIPVLLSLGKDHVYVWEKKEGYLHENEAAERLAKLAAGWGISLSEVKEGKINLIADYSGLLKINTELLIKLNSLGEIILVTRHNNFPVEKGQKVAGTRVIPLIIKEDKIKEAENLAEGQNVVWILPFRKIKVGLVITGNEVYYSRIKDGFGPVVRKKLADYSCEIVEERIVPDNSKKIANSIKELINKGAQMIICTGGMSVDPDDVTPTGIKKVGAKIISYGAPVLPGSMFLLAYRDNIPILGLPGCVMYFKTTVFDLVLPRVLVGDKITQEDIASYGHGGLCLECENCNYPRCSFGKGR